MQPNNYPRFCDFAEDVRLFEGTKKKIDDILNQEILILDFKIKESKKRQGTSYATIQFRQGDTCHIAFTGSGVIIAQLTRYKENLPFYATIKKIDKYYTFA